MSLKLAELVSEVASRHKGHVVKMLGDGVHFHFEDPHDAVTASLEIVDTVRPAGLPPAHVGVNAGPMIYEEGDYFGRTVNIAARIASQRARIRSSSERTSCVSSRRADSVSSRSAPSSSRGSRSR